MNKTPIYYCPICPIERPGWLKYWKRNDHMKRNHPGEPYPKGPDNRTPNGCGLKEWLYRRDGNPDIFDPEGKLTFDV